MLQWGEEKQAWQEKKNVYSFDRTIREQLSVLGATCSFKSAVSVCLMDFEELQVDMDQGLKNKTPVWESCSCEYSNNNERNPCREEMNHHACYNCYMRIYIC